jgi:hypothetical protein
MKAGKPQKQALAIAYSTKRNAKKMAKGGSVPMQTGDDKSAYARSTCPDCYAEGGKCMAHGGDVQHMAEGGRVKDKRELHTKGDDANHELNDINGQDTERSEFGYGESSEEASERRRDMPQLSESEGGRRPGRGSELTASDTSGPERAMPQAHEPISLADEIISDRQRRKMGHHQGSAEAPEGNVRAWEANAKDGSDTKRARHTMGPKHGHVPHDDTPTRSKPTATLEDLYERDDSLKMAQGGMTPISSQAYEDDASMNEESEVGSLQGAIDASSHAPKAPDTGEENSEPEDGRASRGLNLEPVHVMDDPEHDTSEASDQSDYGDNDDSLVGEILRDRKRKRRGM